MVEISSFSLICDINVGAKCGTLGDLWKWVNRKVDFVVVHVVTSYLQRGTGKLDLGEFGK